jgi:carboxylesterase type B
LEQTNISTTAQLVNYLSTIFFHDATVAQVQGLVDVYPDDPAQGSPFNTGLLYNIYPQYKRLAAILGDLTFTLTRRVFLNLAQQANPNVPSWSYLATYFAGTPVLGTFHATDIPQVYGITPGVPQTSIQAYYISFINTMNPNTGTSALLPKWPQWSVGKQLIDFGALTNTIITDDFRSTAYNYLAMTASAFHI